MLHFSIIFSKRANAPFFHNIFKNLVFQRRQKALLWSKGLTLRMLGRFACFLLCLLILFYNQLNFQEYYQRVKQFGSRSDTHFASKIWDQIVYNGYHQMTEVTICGERVNR